MNKDNTNQAGKGDSPRSCFSQKYRDNYDNISWNKKNEKIQINLSVDTTSKRGLPTPQ